MALKLFPIALPIFSPPPLPSPPNPLLQPSNRPFTELRFSRWNNAGAEKFNERRRAQQEIEDDIRRQRRFGSAITISNIHDSATPEKSFRSIGTPSSPSFPSIPGKKSKYSKSENPKYHPAFRKFPKLPRSLNKGTAISRKADIHVSEDGVSYVIDGAPFEFKYSYTETPKAQPLKLREAPFSPFGPTTMPRPWTGRAPLPPSKKKLKEFDSFRLPPLNKKGVKPVQAPGPFLPGSSPRYVKTREEILGEPLTKEEVKELVNGCLKSKRQLNMGRDGLTHNMLDNIHAHWKRRRVCKIKCKGVCTVDMDNVCRQLEERTGGKIIYRRGGVLYLFRGRNYNYKIRPRFPLMLWKPVTPVYPRLIQRVPDGLTLEEATEMRKKGRTLIPICKLGKNGVYSDLVKIVREAFEVCELVRINCQGMNGSDYRKIGAKLKELVPCVLISFEHEHILMWRGSGWVSITKAVHHQTVNGCAPLPPIPLEDTEKDMLSVNDVSPLNINTFLMGSKEQAEEQSSLETNQSNAGCESLAALKKASSSADEYEVLVDAYGNEDAEKEMQSVNDLSPPNINTYLMASEEQVKDPSSVEINEPNLGCESLAALEKAGSSAVNQSKLLVDAYGNDAEVDHMRNGKNVQTVTSVGSYSLLGSIGSREMPKEVSESSYDVNEPAKFSEPYVEVVLRMWNQAVQSGNAVVLGDDMLDADLVYQRAVAFAKSAPLGPVFKRPHRRFTVAVCDRQGSRDLDVKEVKTVVEEGAKLQRPKKINKQCLDAVPQGSLRVDELAKLLG